MWCLSAIQKNAVAVQLHLIYTQSLSEIQYTKDTQAYIATEF